jgi:predicted nucleic acid-binding protein
MERAFMDTGAWYAYINIKDPDHSKVREILESFNGRLITSSYIFDEIVTLVLARLGHQTTVKVGEVLLSPRALEMVKRSENATRGF